MRCSALLPGVWLLTLYVERAWRTMWSNSAWGFLESSHHPSPSALKGDHRTPFRPMRAFFRSVSASFSTTFCFWAAMRSFVFSLSLKGRKVCSCEATVEKLQRNFTVLWRSQISCWGEANSDFLLSPRPFHVPGKSRSVADNNMALLLQNNSFVGTKA